MAITLHAPPKNRTTGRRSRFQSLETARPPGLGTSWLIYFGAAQLQTHQSLIDPLPVCSLGWLAGLAGLAWVRGGCARALDKYMG